MPIGVCPAPQTVGHSLLTSPESDCPLGDSSTREGNTHSRSCRGLNIKNCPFSRADPILTLYFRSKKEKNLP